MSKSELKKRAIVMRKEGKTYSEILAVVPVAKSTLSDWLHNVGLAQKQKQRITQKRQEAQQKGAEARRTHRIEVSKDIYARAITDVGTISKRELWLIGVALYWAEGSKARSYRVTQRIDFGNTDPQMIKLFVRWLFECCDVTANDLLLSIYLHKNHAHRKQDVIQYWEQVLPFKNAKIEKVYYKRHNVKTIRKHTDAETYFGTLRVTVAKSTNLERMIRGWIYGITGEPCRVV